MKKKLVMVLMAVMVATAALGGCGQKGATTDSSVSAEEEKDVEIPAKDIQKHQEIRSSFGVQCGSSGSIVPEHDISR